MEGAAEEGRKESEREKEMERRMEGKEGRRWREKERLRIWQEMAKKRNEREIPKMVRLEAGNFGKMCNLLLHIYIERYDCMCSKIFDLSPLYQKDRLPTAGYKVMDGVFFPVD